MNDFAFKILRVGFKLAFAWRATCFYMGNANFGYGRLNKLQL